MVFYGIPYQYHLNMLQKLQISFFCRSRGLTEVDYLTFDALRILAQLVSKSLSTPHDYLLAYYVDKVRCKDTR
jgi:hypothetical protein